MSIIRPTGILALALVLMLTAGAATASAKGSKNKGGNKDHGVRGTVTAVDGNSITVETRKRGNQKFQITSSTTIERLGKHGQTKPSKEAKAGKTGKRGNAAKIRKIKEGSRVQVTTKGDTAEKITVKRKKGHKGKHSS